VFLAHPAGGSTFVYRQLVELLGPDQPVYGLERLDEAGPVPERAARYASLIRQVCPAGPYRLGGWSFGGVLAYETARQLVADGEQVDALALIDAGLPVPVPAERAAHLLTERFLGFLRYLRETYQLPVEVAPARLHGLTGDEQFRVVLAEMSRAGVADRLPAAVLRHQIDSHTDTRALDDYRPGPYRGPVTLYRCTEPTPWTVRDPRYEHTDAARGWDRWCAELRIVPVTGHHLNLLDPPAVGTIAADLRRLL
jgi:thioesterase domain-containing protein